MPARSRDNESGSRGPHFHLRPLGVAARSQLAELIAEGAAAPLAGGWAAFTHVEIRHGDGDEFAPVIAAIGEVDDILAHEGDADRAALAAAFDRLTRPRPAWRLGGGRSLAFDRPRVMGVVNVTPDSFSDGGRYVDPDRAVAHARALIAEGADIVDIGGESTRPGAEPVQEEEELARVIPVIEGLSNIDIPISVDTRRAEVMRQAVAAGAAIINDVSGLTFEEDSLEAAAASDAGIVLMHSRGTPQDMQTDPRYRNVGGDTYDWLQGRVDAAEKAGIAPDRLAVDPGIGFGQTTAHIRALLRGQTMFHGIGLPLLMGVSRKRFIGEITGVAEAGDRLAGSLAGALACAAAGAQIIRVHDVAATRQALALAHWLDAPETD